MSKNVKSISIKEIGDDIAILCAKYPFSKGKLKFTESISSAFLANDYITIINKLGDLKKAPHSEERAVKEFYNRFETIVKNLKKLQ